MASLNLNSLDLSPGPDLHPPYPTSLQINTSLSSHSGLSPAEKSELVAHCASRACVFGDLSLLQYLLTDSQAQAHLDLAARDEDGLGLVSLAIYGFGADSDRDIEREECVRLLVAQGADLQPDEAGWTPLHHAALLSPPTLISYLMTHGCSPFALTKRSLTPLDIVTAHSMLPGREDVALLLEEAMRSEGWEGSRMDQRRRFVEQQQKRRGRRKELREDVTKILGLSPNWWGQEPEILAPDSDSDDDEDDITSHDVYTPPLDYSSMLVFSPSTLPQILESIITNYTPSLKDSTPANSLYMLTRFACLACDYTWLEDLVLSATDAVEEAFFNRSEDITCLVFWLYNTTLWLHLIQCDNSINEACEVLGSFDLVEEVVNSVFVLIIRVAERRIDTLLDTSLLDFSPLSSDIKTIQFESEWSFFRSFTGRKKVATTNTLRLPPPISPGRTFTPSQSQPNFSPRNFSSLRQSNGKRPPSTPLNSLFSDVPADAPSPVDLTSYFSALHSFLIMADINPVLITQLWSQVFYWTACEMFNRIITRKKYICRSRAVQISRNLLALEEWIPEAGLPPGIQSHFVPVKDLLNWLQCISSISEFADLVATIQSMKSINPLQMRRAVRDYKYEVNEEHMTEECIQYLTQLQKDWERHRVKMGVEAMRKEINERDRDRDSTSSMQNETDQSFSSNNSDGLSPHLSIDTLFDKTQDASTWEPIKPPQPLGELLDSRYMIPLMFPSDPRLLAALPRKLTSETDGASDYQSSRRSMDSSSSRMTGSEAGGIMCWRSQDRKIREVSVVALQKIDGTVSAARWGRPIDPRFTEDNEDEEKGIQEGGREKTLHVSYSADDLHRIVEDETVQPSVHITPLTRKPSARRGRQSIGETTPVDPHKRHDF